MIKTIVKYLWGKAFVASLLSVVATPIFAAADAGTMTDTERTYLVEQLESSKKGFLDSIAGLTPAEWTFKAAPARWSVAQCAEHLVLAEGFIFSGTQGVLQSPAVPRPDKSNSEVDHAFVAGVTDRSHKVTAPEQIVPKGKYATPEDAAAAFTEARDKTISYAKTTTDALRVHVGPGPAGPMDAYQFMLLIAAHSARHTAQIREVEASPGRNFHRTNGPPEPYNEVDPYAETIARVPCFVHRCARGCGRTAAADRSAIVFRRP